MRHNSTGKKSKGRGPKALCPGTRMKDNWVVDGIPGRMTLMSFFLNNLLTFHESQVVKRNFTCPRYLRSSIVSILRSGSNVVTGEIVCVRVEN